MLATDTKGLTTASQNLFSEAKADLKVVPAACNGSKATCTKGPRFCTKAGQPWIAALWIGVMSMMIHDR